MEAMLAMNSTSILLYLALPLIIFAVAPLGSILAFRVFARLVPASSASSVSVVVAAAALAIAVSNVDLQQAVRQRDYATDLSILLSITQSSLGQLSKPLPTGSSGDLDPFIVPLPLAKDRRETLAQNLEVLRGLSSEHMRAGSTVLSVIKLRVGLMTALKILNDAGPDMKEVDFTPAAVDIAAAHHQFERERAEQFPVYSIGGLSFTSTPVPL